MNNIVRIAAINLIDSIQKDNLLETKNNILILNENFIYPDESDMSLNQILSIGPLAYTITNGYNNSSLMYTLDHLNNLIDADKIKWELQIRYLEKDHKEAEKFILNYLNNPSEWIHVSYKFYGILRLITSTQNFDLLVKLKSLLNEGE